MVLLVFFEAVYFGHFLSLYTMQLEPPKSVDFFRECFYSSLTLTELRSRMQAIVDACGCHASKQSNSRDRGLISSLPILYCANSLL